VSVRMTLSDLERRDARGQLFQPDLKNSRIVWPGTTKFGTVTRVFEIELYLGDHPDQPRPNFKGRGPSTSQFLGSFYLCIHYLTQNYQI